MDNSGDPDRLPFDPLSLLALLDQAEAITCEVAAYQREHPGDLLPLELLDKMARRHDIGRRIDLSIIANREHMQRHKWYLGPPPEWPGE